MDTQHACRDGFNFGSVRERKKEGKSVGVEERETININAYHHAGGDGVLAVHARQGVGVQQGSILVVHANVTLIWEMQPDLKFIV